MGAGPWWGGAAFGRLEGSLRSAGYTPEEINVVLVTHLHSDDVGGLTTQDGKRVFPNADVYVAKAESDFWLSPEIAAKAPKDVYEFSSKGQKILFWGDVIHALRVQLRHPEVTAIFDIDPTAAAATRNQLLPKLAREDVLIAGPHMNFPALGRLQSVASHWRWPMVLPRRYRKGCLRRFVPMPIYM